MTLDDKCQGLQRTHAAQQPTTIRTAVQAIQDAQARYEDALSELAVALSHRYPLIATLKSGTLELTFDPLNDLHPIRELEKHPEYLVSRPDDDGAFHVFSQDKTDYLGDVKLRADHRILYRYDFEKLLPSGTAPVSTTPAALESFLIDFIENICTLKPA
jgi:hypothetical protein